jgi:hypothetical protein
LKVFVFGCSRNLFVSTDPSQTARELVRNSAAENGCVAQTGFVENWNENLTGKLSPLTTERTRQNRFRLAGGAHFYKPPNRGTHLSATG